MTDYMDYMILSSGEGREEQRLNFGLNEVPLPEAERFVSEANGRIRILLRNPRDMEHCRPEEVTVNLSPDMVPQLYDFRFNLYYKNHYYQNLPALGAFLKEFGFQYANFFPAGIPKYKGEEKEVREAVTRRHILEDFRPSARNEVDVEELAAKLFDSEMAPLKVARGRDGMLYVFDMEMVRKAYSWAEAEKDKINTPEDHAPSHGCRMC